jgi:hypothetical protein
MNVDGKICHCGLYLWDKSTAKKGFHVHTLSILHAAMKGALTMKT